MPVCLSEPSAMEKFYVNSFAPVTPENIIIYGPLLRLSGWPLTYISSCTINYTLGLINGILWIAIICLYIFKENFVSQRRLLWFICQFNHLQDSRALRADEGTDGHVDVRRPPLSTIKAFSVSRKWTQLPQDLQVTIVLLFPHCCCHPGLGIDDVCWWWCGGIRFEVVARASTALNAPEEFLSIFFVN